MDKLKVFHVEGEQIKPEIISSIKDRINTTVVVWHGDQRPDPEKHIIDLCKVSDWLFHTTAGKRLREYHSLTKVKSAFFIFPTDPEIFYKKSVSKKWKSDILFTGSYHPFITKERENLINTLLKRSDFRIYGHGYGRVIRGKKYIRAIRGTKIGLNINAFNNFKYYSSERLMNYMSCGTFTLSSYSPGLDKIFTDKKEVVFFRSPGECLEYIDYYLKNDKVRELIAINGMRKYHEVINNANTVNEMLNIIFNNKTGFPWTEVFI